MKSNNIKLLLLTALLIVEVCIFVNSPQPTPVLAWTFVVILAVLIGLLTTDIISYYLSTPCRKRDVLNDHDYHDH